MKVKLILISFLLIIFTAQINFAQILPTKIKSYLDKNYESWKLTKDKCGDADSKAIIEGNFNADKKLDFAVKFTRGNKGYIIAFLAQSQNYKAFVLHKNISAEEAVYLSLNVWKKGEIFKSEGKRLRLKHDAPSDYRCESDVGGIHYYHNGKFVGY